MNTPFKNNEELNSITLSVIKELEDCSDIRVYKQMVEDLVRVGYVRGYNDRKKEENKS
jgi:hypothetical protein